MAAPVIEVRDVGKGFTRPVVHRDTLREHVFAGFSRRATQRFTVLDRDNMAETSQEAKILGSAQTLRGATYVITGDDRPNGTDAFQATFFVGLNCAGRVGPSATPVPFGPRNCSQSFVTEGFAFWA